MPEAHKFSNEAVVKELKEVLAAMEVKNANRFRIRAYQNAISAIENITTTVYDMWENDRLNEIAGVGATLEQHLTELFKTGKVREFESTKKGLPQGMFSLIGLRGIGAKRAFKLAEAFKLTDRQIAVEKLKEAAETGQIKDLEGFGEKMETDILNAITELKMHKREKPRMLLTNAEEISSRILKYLEDHPNVDHADALGSLRRREATVGDLDIAVATTDGNDAIDYFLKYPEIEDILSKGDKKAGVVLTNGVQVDVRVSSPKAYGSMIQYFTGSKQHNVYLRTFALEKGLSLSEYGIKEGEQLHEFATEKHFYEFLGLPHIPPELRQGKDELEIAKQNKLPKLVQISDIQGDLHTHTIFSDGANTLSEMIESAKQLGYDYIGISDHAPSVVSRGESNVKSIIDTQRRNIEEINASSKDFKALFGYEVHILSNAELALPDKFLAKLDYAIASVHTAFDQDREQITKRLLTAIKNPYIKIIGHPTGRLINSRKSIDADWSLVFEAAIKNDKIFEINSQPDRLDLPDDLVHQAVKSGLKLIVDTDAHNVHSLNLMQYGIDVARRGWCTKENIVNTLPLQDFLRSLGI